MPKAYTDEERLRIMADLKKEAINCMIQYGVRRTTVDELVHRTNIPKGTFYLFYKSKEMLLFDALNEVHDTIQSTLIAELGQMFETKEKGKALTVDDVTEMIFRFYKIADESNLIKMLVNKDLELLMRKLPKEMLESHFMQDKLSMEQFMEFIPGIKGKSFTQYESALRAVFLTMLHKREIGESGYDDTVRLLFRGIVLQMME